MNPMVRCWAGGGGKNNEIFTVTLGDHLFLAEEGMRP